MDTAIRKQQHTLFIAGYAIILFGIWDIVKTILNLTINSSLYRMVDEQSIDMPHEVKMIITVFTGFIVFVVLLTSILIRLTVGRTAIRLGMGEDRKCGAMIFWSVFLLLTNLSGATLSVFGITKGEDSINMAGSFLVDLTSFFMLTGMLISLYKLKKLTGQAGG